MKKLLVILIVAISLLSTLTSCADYAAKADYEEQINATTHEDAGNGRDHDDEETGTE